MRYPAPISDRRSGIYEICCTSNGVRYVGSAIDLRGRSYTHIYRLTKGDHHSKFMQRSWSKYGSGAFVWRVLLVCEPENLEMYEQRAIDRIKPRFNSNLTAQVNLGLKRSPEFRAACSARMVAHFSSGEARQAQSERLKRAYDIGTGSMAGAARLRDVDVRAKALEAINSKHQKHEYKGEMLSCGDVARKYGVAKNTFRARVKRGWSVAAAIETPSDRSKVIGGGTRYGIEQLTVAEISEASGKRKSSVFRWLLSGLSVRDILDKGVGHGRS